MSATTTRLTGPEMVARAAATYARRGLPVFPLHEIRPDGSCGCPTKSCDDVGKHPATMGWQRTIASVEAAASAWPPDAERERGIGLALGPRRARMWALDADPRHGGDESLAELVSEHGALPGTWTTKTGSGGLHYLFSWPEDIGEPIRNSAGKIAPGIDVRGLGGFIVLPPSRHVSGRRYSWEVEPDGRPTTAPAWLVELARTPSRAASFAPMYGDLRRGPGEVRVGAGRRHNELVSLLGLMRWWGASEKTLVAAALAFVRTQCVDDDPSRPIDLAHVERQARDAARRWQPGRDWR